MKRIIGPVGLSTVSLWVLPATPLRGSLLLWSLLTIRNCWYLQTIRLNRPFNALPITLPGEVWRVDPDRRLRGKTSMITPGDRDAALADLVVVGGEVARVSEPERGQLCEAQTMLEKHQLDTLEVASLVHASLCSVAKKGSRNIDADVLGGDQSWVISFGAFCRGSQVSLVTATKVRPMLLRLLNRFVSSFDAAHEYTALRISFNAVADFHRDVHNQHGYRNMIVCLSEFAGGRVITPDGPLEYSGGKAYIDPLVPHGVEPSVAPRLVVVAYTPGFAAELSVLDIHILLSLSFNVPAPYRPIPLELKPSVRAVQARVQDEGATWGRSATQVMLYSTRVRRWSQDRS